MSAMSLKSTVRAAIMGVAGGCLLVIAVTAGAYSMLKTIQEEVSYASSVSANVTKLNLLTSELLMRQSERVILQLKRQHAILSGQLANPPRFNSRADILAAELALRVAKLKIHFGRLETSLAPEGQASDLNKEARDILFTSVIAQSGALHSRSLEMGETMSENAASVHRIVFMTIGGGFLIMIVGGGLLMSILSHGLLARILELRAVIQEIGSGNLDAQIPIPTRDEMGDVLRELDQMRMSLLRSLGELGRVNLELVAAKADLEDRVAERTAGLEAANSELESFTYAVSHDLRAPLRTISGFSQAVLEDYGPKLDEEGRSMLMRVHRATGRMGQLIDDLLKLSRIDSTSPNCTDVNLSEIAAGIGETLRERAPERQVLMTIQPNIHAQCDGRLVAIVLTNLLENAWKFTARTPGAAIEFGREQDGAHPIYFVHDNGAGFEMAYCDKLFQPFQRLHSADQFPGTGIGLATVARIIRAHGGKIWATSEPDKGAKFCFQFGNASRRAAPDEPADEDRRQDAMDDSRVVQMVRAS
jgi:signal transduction histidine kinase